ncbi:nitrile hydratase subunit beta [Rhodomicrobium sp. Az07]|uniref:SH3-like domain-containing protein n=1 Tax=Rhodomicrobium sp. Az07 TaxID=2839034 RepID=UPI001BE55DAC|nr:SH3-like domain-containing protein [Rhodomicrobium sp. Az07]MBT3069377.1 nitrile hydratase subunit beta [Rhodomicrobium sp. Az07]
MQEAPRKQNDIGGSPAGAIEFAGHESLPWHDRVEALVTLVQHPARGLFTPDEIRRRIENAAAEGATYHERAVVALANALLERGAITGDELADALDAISKQGRP